VKTRALQLGDVVLSADPGFASGENPASGVVQLRMNNVSTDGAIDWSEIRRVPANGPKAEKYALAPGDVVFNSTNSPDLVGKTALFLGFKEPVVFSNHFLRIRVEREAADPGYVARWLSFQWKRRTFENLCTRWVNQASVRKDDLLDLQMSLPELSEQRRIAERLERADRLCRTRRYALELTDTFLPAAFLELFGAGSFSRVALEELATDERNSFVNGPFGSDLLTSELTDSGVPVIYIRDISSGRYERISSVFVTPAKAVELRFCNAKPGDVLVAKVGDPPGIAAIYPAAEPEGIVTQDVIRIRTNTEIVSAFYLQGFLNSRLAHQEMTKIMVEGTRLRFSLGHFKEISVPAPPLALQQKFAGLVERVEYLRTVQREALRQAEHLFASLLHRAFSG